MGREQAKPDYTFSCNQWDPRHQVLLSASKIQPRNEPWHTRFPPVLSSWSLKSHHSLHGHHT